MIISLYWNISFTITVDFPLATSYISIARAWIFLKCIERVSSFSRSSLKVDVLPLLYVANVHEVCFVI